MSSPVRGSGALLPAAADPRPLSRLDPKHGPASLTILEPEREAVRVEDLAGHGQTDALPAGLGAEKRREQLRGDRGRETGAGVANLEALGPVLRYACDGDLARRRHRLARVLQ